MKYIYLTFIAFVLLSGNLLAQDLPENEQSKITKLEKEAKNYISENNKSKLAETYNKIAYIYLNNNSLTNAANSFQKSLKINEELGNKNAKAKISNYLGSIYSRQKKHKEALKYFQFVLKICKRKNDNHEIAVSYLQVAQEQKELKQYDRALKNLSHANKISEELYHLNLLKSIAFKYVEIYKITGDKEKEIEYFQKYSTYDKYIRSKDAESKLEKNNELINNILAQNNEAYRALSLSEKELKIQDSLMSIKSDSLKSITELTEKQRLQHELDQLEIEQTTTKLEKDKILKYFLFSIFAGFALLAGVLFYANKQKQKANKLLFLQNKKIKKQTSILEEKNSELKKLSLVAAKTDNAILIMDSKGNFEWVNESFTRIFNRSFEELINSTPNIISPNTSPKIVQIINRCINNKETVFYNLAVNSANDKETIVHVTLTPILNKKDEIDKIIAIDSDITEIKKANLQIEKQNKILEEQNEHITSSINYAKTIQTASLPKANEFNKVYDSFLIYKPKDIVSGDFYWFTDLSKNENEFNKFIISVIDSTGHGVPGAFMSLIGTQILNQTILSRKNYNPALIIEKLDRKIISSLSQRTTENKDGMDLGVALVEKQENGKFKITYAGAKRPLYIFRKEKNELESLRGTRRSVGGIKKTVTEVEFQNITTELSAGDCIYLTSDGLVDQPNSKRVRYGSAKLTSVLQSFGLDDMTMQKEKLLNTYHSHTQETAQRDDITVLGIKLS